MSSENRWMKILDCLTHQVDISDKELKKNVGCVLPTVRKDIEKLNELLEDTASIHLNNHCYSIEVYDSNDFQKALAGGFKKNLDFNSSHKRIAFILDSLLNKDTYIKIDDLCDEMMISRSTLNNDIKKAKEYLNKYDVMIQGVTNKGITLKGNEFNLRLAMIYLVCNYYEHDFYSNVFTKQLEKISEYYQLDLKIQNLLCSVVDITIDRLVKNKKLMKPISFYRTYETKELLLIQLYNQIEKNFSIKLTKWERDFISFPINTKTSVISNEGNKKYEAEIRDLFDKMMKKIEEVYYIKISGNLFDQMKNHLMVLINRMVFRIPLNDIFSDQIKEKFPLAFQMARLSAEILQEKYDLFVGETEISYLAIYYALFLEDCKDIERKIPKIKSIAVFSNRGNGAFELIKRQIEDILGKGIIIYHLNENDLNENDLSKFDIIFNMLPIHIDYKGVIRIANIFDKEYIVKRIKNYERKQLYLSSEDIRNFVNISLFKLAMAYDYQTSVSLMIDDLRNLNQIDDGFYNRWKERESIQDMIFDKGIAIPHALNKGNDKLILSIGIFNSVKKEKNKDLKIIFLLGVPEKLDNMNVLTQIFDKIFSIGTNDDVYREMISVKTVDECIELLLGKG